MTYQPPQSPFTPGAAPYQPVADAGRRDERGFFASLFDFGFNSFITPKVIKFLYVLVMILAVLAALAMLIVAFNASPTLGVLSLLIVCPLYLLLIVAGARVTLEFFMVVFRMGADMRAIRNRGGAGLP